MDESSLKSIFRSPPVLFTDRLVLRKMDKRDSSDMFLYAGDAEVTKYLLWSPHADESYTYKYLSSLPARYRAGEFFDWAVTYNGRMIGNCGFTRLDLTNKKGEIGYVIARDLWNMGFGTEAARRVMEFGFEVLGLHRIEIQFMEGNTASRKVGEKIGMTFEGIHKDSIFVKGEYKSIGVCAILDEEYKALYHR